MAVGQDRLRASDSRRDASDRVRKPRRLSFEDGIRRDLLPGKTASRAGREFKSRGKCRGWKVSENVELMVSLLTQQTSPRTDFMEQFGSPAWKQFLDVWFGEDYPALSRDEIDRSFVRNLTVGEMEEARVLMRGSLRSKQKEFIEGVADLGDLESIPELRLLFESEGDLSRRLTIAGSLWRLARDPCFANCIEEMVAGGSADLKAAHIHQILWLRDEMVLNFLVRLLDDADGFVRHLALSKLIEIETGKSSLVVDRGQFPAERYRLRREDPGFRRLMVANVRLALQTATNVGLNL